MFARKPSNAMLVTLCAAVAAATAIDAAGQIHLAQFQADDPMLGDGFGRSVAIDGDLIAVGVPSSPAAYALSLPTFCDSHGGRSVHHTLEFHPPSP
ncbi:MAG: FG-GAP repeat protein [Planctomycetes bacterium]|nr:FG-GAP repeat protein [Planctomycetota bacterium]